jgi:hypothetical protein
MAAANAQALLLPQQGAAPKKIADNLNLAQNCTAVKHNAIIAKRHQSSGKRGRTEPPPTSTNAGGTIRKQPGRGSTPREQNPRPMQFQVVSTKADNLTMMDKAQSHTQHQAKSQSAVSAKTDPIPEKGPSKRNAATARKQPEKEAIPRANQAAPKYQDVSSKADSLTTMGRAESHAKHQTKSQSADNLFSQPAKNETAISRAVAPNRTVSNAVQMVLYNQRSPNTLRPEKDSKTHFKLLMFPANKRRGRDGLPEFARLGTNLGRAKAAMTDLKFLADVRKQVLALYSNKKQPGGFVTVRQGRQDYRLAVVSKNEEKNLIK